MKGFSGFPDGKQSLIMVPSLFFSEVMPQIDNLNELKVSLYCIWALNAQEGEYRYVRYSEMLADKQLVQALSPANIQDGLERALARGVLLHVRVQLAHEYDDLYFLNSQKGRAALQAIQQNNWLPGDELRPIAFILDRPNLYKLYEQNVGIITPMIAEQLQDMEKEYPLDWIQDAIQIAVTNQIRSLNYIIKILERWRKDGRIAQAQRANQITEDDLAAFEEEFAHLIND